MKWYKDRSSVGQTLFIHRERVVLPAGDYALKGHQDSCIIERKGSLNELANNLLGDDWARAQDAFKRLSEATANPYLMVECTPADLRTRSRYIQEPDRVVDALAALIERMRFRLILCGKVVDVKQKLTVGTLMLRLMLAHAYQKEIDFSGVDAIIEQLKGGSKDATQQRATDIRDGG